MLLTRTCAGAIALFRSAGSARGCVRFGLPSLSTFVTSLGSSRLDLHGRLCTATWCQQATCFSQAVEISEPETKSCSVCRRSRPVTEYWKRAASKDGLQLICKDCQKSLVARLKESRKDWPQYNGQLECATCEKLKPVQDFNKCVGTLHGWQYVCRACSTHRLRNIYTRSKELHQHMSGQHKFCRRCQLEKSTEQFYRNAGHTDGLQSFCKLCMKAEGMHRRSRRKA